MNTNPHGFLGGSPIGVLVKLLFLSLLVGAFMAFIGLTPAGLIAFLRDIVESIADLGFGALGEIGRWILYGAVIVVPIWLLGRIFGTRR